MALWFAASALAQEPALRTERVEISVSDGTILRGTLRVPSGGAERRPAIVELTPYSGAQRLARTGGFPLELAREGYATLLVDVRGTGVSNGDFCFLCAREIRDGADVVEWIARQPWSDGQIGIVGYSYGGILASRTAALRPPHLRAVAAGSTFNDAYRDVLFPGGLLASDGLGLGPLFTAIPVSRINGEAAPGESLPAMRDALGRRTTVLNEALTRPTDGPFWRERSLQEEAPRIEAPALFYTGWHDIYARGTPRTFRTAGSAEKALVVGPHGHLVDQGGFELAAKRWFEVFLRTRPGPARSLAAAQLPRVLLFDQGPGAEEWRRFDRWVPEHESQVLRLCPAGRPAVGPWLSGGTLQDRDCGAAGAAAVPSVPVELTAGTSIVHDAGDPRMHDALDQRLAPVSAAFVGAPLKEALTITGPLAVRFTARTYGTDADWMARIVDVAPDGATRQVGRGWLKASHRREDRARAELFHTHTNPQRLVPGQAYELAVEVWPTAYRLPPGNRLGVLLTAADTQKVLPTGQSAASELVVTREQPATLTVPARSDSGTGVTDFATAFAAGDRPPPSDNEPCHASIRGARAVTDGEVARVMFSGAARVVAETKAPDGRLVVRRVPASGDVAWDGRGADGEPVRDGHYVLALLAGAGDGVTIRRLTVTRRRGRLRAGPRIERAPNCGLLRTFRLASGPTFVRDLKVRYSLGRRARVSFQLLRGRRVVRRLAARVRGAGEHVVTLPAPRAGRGLHAVRIVVRDRSGVTVRSRLEAHRIRARP